MSHSPLQLNSSLRSRSVGVLIGSLALASLALSGCSSSSTTEQDPNALATSLVTAAWDSAVAGDNEAFTSLSSSAYRLQRADGTGAWLDEYQDDLDDPAAYDLSGYTLSDLQARQDGDILVVSYYMDIELTRDGKPFPQGPTPFLASYVERDGKWLLVTEANFGGN